ncbi:MAG: hypothetical protein R6V07_06050 [Armatimonadota bacterium]
MPESSGKPQQCYPARGDASILRNPRSFIIMIIILLTILVLLGLAAQYWARECQVPESEQLREELSEIEPIDRPENGSYSPTLADLAPDYLRKGNDPRARMPMARDGNDRWPTGEAAP